MKILNKIKKIHFHKWEYFLPVDITNMRYRKCKKCGKIQYNVIFNEYLFWKNIKSV